jgi:internalin A
MLKKAACIPLALTMLNFAAPQVYAADTDIRLMYGFPKQIGEIPGGGEQIFHDLDGDGINEVIATGNGKVYAWHLDGTPYSNNPDGTFFSLGKRFEISAPPAVGDVTGDGIDDIVIAADRVYVVDLNGNLIMDLNINGESHESPVIADIDLDGKAEIMCVNQHSHLYVYDNNGDLRTGFPLDYVRLSPAVADLDPNFYGLELVVGDNDGLLWAIHNDGTIVTGFPVRSGLIDSCPAIGDIDGDGNLDIVVGTDDQNLLVISSEGQLKPGWPQRTGLLYSSPALADIDADGKLEIFAGDFDGLFYGFRSDGNLITGFPARISRYIVSSPIVSDINNDNIPEVLVGSGDGKLYAWKTTTGQLIYGFPLNIGEDINSSPIVGTDGNASTLIGISSGEYPDTSRFYLYNLGPNTWNPDMQPWPMLKHDPQRTGNYHHNIQMAPVPVYFPDPNLEAAIREELGIVGQITDKDLAGLVVFSAWGEDITNLTGIQYCINLRDLGLWSNQISDISPLSGLINLQYLDLEENQISDIKALSALTNLGALYLDGNQITDISPLSGLTNLQELGLGSNQVSDISPLGGLTNLQKLGLCENQISDISPLSGLANLQYLGLLGNQISDISPLSGLTNLQKLDLDDNQISDISPLSGLTNLQYLGLDENQISDISPLSGLTNLQYLYLWANQISDISPLSGLTNLQVLYLWGNQISDISPLSGLTNLQELHLWGSQISDISPLSRLTNLQYLGLDENQISDISPLSGLTNLQELGLWANQISDISPLSRLINLLHLDLDENQVSDISPLKSLTNLEGLSLYENQISDISPLGALTNLWYLGLNENQISDISPLVSNTGLGEGDEVGLSGNPLNNEAYTTHIPALQRRGVYVEFDEQKSADKLSPTISSLRPKKSSENQGPISKIHVELYDNVEVDPDSITMKVNGEKVSLTIDEIIGGKKVVGYSADYISETPLPDGEVVVEIEASDINGNEMTETYSFTVKSPSADTNNDGSVNIEDLIEVAKSFGATTQDKNLYNPEADLNNDGIVDILDLILVARNIGVDAAPPENDSDYLPALTALYKMVEDYEGDIPGKDLKHTKNVLAGLIQQHLPKQTTLSQNYPNPFNPDTWIPYELAEQANVAINIYNTSGRLVRTLDLGNKEPGIYFSKAKAAYWDGRNDFGETVASGIYFYQIMTSDLQSVRKMTLLR